MKRREFIAALGGAAAWPLSARAQQPERLRHIGMLNALGQDDPEAQARIAVFEQTLQQLGWVVGRNLKIEIRQIGHRCRPPSQRRCGDGRTRAGRDPYHRQCGGCAAATGHSYYPDRVRERPRSGRCRLRPKHGPPGRQYHRLLEFRVQHER